MTLELIAISEAMSEAASLNSDRIVILTDSKSALQHLARCASGIRGAPIAYVVLKQIHEFNSSGKTLSLQWADSDGISCAIKMSYYEYLSNIKKLCYNHYKEYFDEKSKDKGIWYKTIQQQPARMPWFIDCIKFKRKKPPL